VNTLHRRLGAVLALVALLAFISGAGLDTLAVIPAAAVLLFALFIRPGPALARAIDPVWRVLALLLAARAVFAVATGRGDPVLPMVDLLLLLLCAGSLRERDASADARHFALTFALLIASAAYRPGPLFGPLFIVYVCCATLVLVLGWVSRQSEQRGLPPTAAPPRFVFRIALLSLAVILVSGAVFVMFPRVSQGWAARPTPVVARSMVGFSDRVSIGSHGARIEPNPEVVLRIEFPDGPPADPASLHWRGRSYNRFDGVTWSRAGAGNTGQRETLWTGPAIEQLIYARRLGDANVIFGLHPILAVRPQSRITPFRISSGDYAYAGDGDPVYRVRSRAATPHADSLRRSPRAYSRDLASFLQLPPLSTRLVALADSFRTAHDNAYDVARAVESWLHGFEYTLDLPRTRREATLDHFLFARRAGHCEYFSTAMAVLLRAAGIPARNVNGFLGGEWNGFGRFLTVTQNNAHSWVEVYFPDYGWVTFDPTPAAAASEISSAHGGSGPLRRFADGLGHRWGKWVLDYNVGTQLSLLERFTMPAPQQRADGTAPGANWWLIGGLLLVPLLLVVFLRRLRAGAPRSTSAAARAYVELLRAYERAGWATRPNATPLAFAADVAQLPGAEHARAAVQIYVRTRFGGQELKPADAAALREHVGAARRALRRSRRSLGQGVLRGG
jgi:transglutaminase-like putative cysteine protease